MSFFFSLNALSDLEHNLDSIISGLTVVHNFFHVHIEKFSQILSDDTMDFHLNDPILNIWK